MENPIKENPLKELEVFHQLAQLIFLSLDKHGRIRYINTQGSRMLGYKREELIGQNWFHTCLPPALEQQLFSLYEDFIEGQKDILEFYQNPILTRDGKQKIFSWHNMLRRDKQGTISGAYATGMDVTDLVHSDQREQYLGKVLEYALNEIYIADADSRQLLYANKIAQSNIGYREIAGLNLQSLIATEAADRFSYQVQQHASSLDRSPRFECRLRRHDGSSYPVEAIVFRSYYRLSPAIVLYAQDISQRLRVQSQLALSESKYQTILDTAAEGIITLNLRGEIDSFNRAAETLFGFTAAEAHGKRFNTLLADNTRDRFQQLEDFFLTQTTNATTPARVEVQIQPRTGNLIDAEIAFTRINLPKALVILVVHDLSQRKATEASLRERERELVNLREQLYHSQRVNQMNALATGIAHEINQPLAAINTYAETAQQIANHTQETTTEIIHALQQIGAQARRAGEVVKTLRGMLKKQKGSRETIDLNKLINTTIELIRPELKENSIQIETRSDEDRILINVDPVQIQQVLLNLLQNSVDSLKQAMEINRKITVETQIIHKDDGNEDVKCAIQDNGIGISNIKGETIFRPFSTTKENGLGMGLTICRDILNSHDGELAISPEHTKGCKVYFTLPLCQDN